MRRARINFCRALFEQRIDLLVGLAERAYGEPDPWQGLVSFMERSAEMMATDKGLRQILMFAAEGHDRGICARDRMRPAIESLIERAQADGQVRADLRPTDVPMIEFMVAAAAEYAWQVRPTVWRRYLALILDALRPASASGRPLPEPELSPDEMAEVMQSNPLSRRRASPRATTITMN